MDGPRTLGPDPTTSAGDSGVQVGAVTFFSGERTPLGDRFQNYRRRPGANDFGNDGPGGGSARRRAAVPPKTALSSSEDGG